MEKNGKYPAGPMKHATEPEPRVAIVYDRLNSRGGAEKVLVALQKLYPHAPLYSSVWNPERTPWLHSSTNVVTSWLQSVPGAKNHHQWFGWLMPLLFESFEIEADIVITVSSEAAKGVVTKPEQLHINYMLTPTRYLWSHTDEYQSHVPRIVRPVMRPVLKLLRAWDAVAAYRPDIIVPISRVVQRRVKHYYHRETAAAIYPPISLPDGTKAPSTEQRALLPETFLLTWGRHVGYKQFDRCIRASVQAGVPLVLAGSGPATRQLERLASQLDPAQEYIHFVGEISDQELRWYLEHAAGTVFPHIEDFGIVIGESLLAGCPVLTHEESGAAELMTAQDGIKIPSSSVEKLVEAMQKMIETPWKRLDIQRRASQYAGERFSQEWSRFVESAWKKHTQALSQKIERNV